MDTASGQFLAIVDTLAPFPVQENPTAQNHGESWRCSNMGIRVFMIVASMLDLYPRFQTSI